MRQKRRALFPPELMTGIMKHATRPPPQPALDTLHKTAAYIASCQRQDGAIPWFPGHYVDPWNHTEAAMALSLCGYEEQAQRAYNWLCDEQLPNGAWWSAHPSGANGHGAWSESHFSAYIATGAWQHYLITDDQSFLCEIWPIVRRAINHVVSLQIADGTIPWGIDAAGTPLSGALRAVCSSVHKSLQCALCLSAAIGDTHHDNDWRTAQQRLGAALRRDAPADFDNDGIDRRRFAMDWFYPVLSGALPKSIGRKRLLQRWDEFVVAGLGCRCVSDQPWVAVAESSELVMALITVGWKDRAARLYHNLHLWHLPDGSYWTGHQFALNIPWPAERTTWTAAAVVLAGMALRNESAAATVLTTTQKSAQRLELPSSGTTQQRQ